MNKKIIYLVLALVLPGLFFVFLKIFGKNHFDIPIYYKDGISDLQSECSAGHPGQYILPDSLMNFLGCKNGEACLFIETREPDSEKIRNLMGSVSSDRLQVITLSNIEPNRLSKIKNCVLFLKEPWQAVLVDKQRQIRGYYSLNSLEETDRLKVEVEILLSNN